jgi:hypothetical protein
MVVRALFFGSRGFGAGPASMAGCLWVKEERRVFVFFALLCKIPCFADSRPHFSKVASNASRHARSVLEKFSVGMYSS